MSFAVASDHKPFIAGVGMVRFTKPGQSDPWDQLGESAARLALEDAKVPYEDIQSGDVGFVYADSTAGQAALYRLGMSGIPIVNVNNNCATGSTAWYLACQAVASGSVEVALALGFEQMNPGKLDLVFGDRKRTMDHLTARLGELLGEDTSGPLNAAMYFGAAGLEHQRTHGTSAQAFAGVTGQSG